MISGAISLFVALVIVYFILGKGNIFKGKKYTKENPQILKKISNYILIIGGGAFVIWAIILIYFLD
tara:strand:- start:1415 stop:1612 length:198 start_codon:yes stop_codon:yes gene_type:complete